MSETKQPSRHLSDGLQIFENNRFGEVRVVMRGREPWFVAKNVCDCLELGNVSQALDGLDDDEKQQLETNIINPDVGGRGTLIISESGLYSLVLRSRKPEAKEFKRWVTHDVLPAIREVELDESKLWWSIKRVAAATGENGRKYSWKTLKSASFLLGLPPRKIFDANFGAINVYHIDVFEWIYPEIKAYLRAVK